MGTERGILITNQATGTILAGNFIGTDDTQTATNLGNLGVGIDVSAGSDGNQIGPGNIVAFNGGPTRPGVRVTNAVGDRTYGDFIDDNGGQGIVLSNGNDWVSASPQLGSKGISAGTTDGERQDLRCPGGQLLRRVLQERLVPTLPARARARRTSTSPRSWSRAAARASARTLGGLALDDVVTATLNEHHDRRHVRVLELRDGAGAAVPSSRPGALHRDCERRPPGRRQARRLPRLPRAARPGHLRRPAPRQRGQREPHSNMVGDDRHLARTTPLQRGGCGERRVPRDRPLTPTGTQTADTGNNPVVAAISSPRAAARILQYGLIPLRGLALNAQGVVGSGAHEWSLSGPRITRSGTGPIVDLQPPTGGWPAGSYTATLEKSGSTDPAERDSVIFNIVADADNDGIPASVESLSCFGTGGDNDPTNAYGDQDADGIPNVDDPQPCTPASSYTAIVDVNPDPLPTGSSGSPITAYVRVPGRNVSQVLGSSVRITGIAGIDVSSNNDLKKYELDGLERRRDGEVRPAEDSPVPGDQRHPQPRDLDNHRGDILRLAAVELLGVGQRLG